MNIQKTGITILLLLILSISYIGCGSGGGNKLSTLPSYELFKLGKQKYDEEKYLKALDYFQALVYNYPGESIVDTAQYYLALSYFGQEEYDLAQVEFNRLVLNYPASVFFENSIFMKAVCFYEGTPTHFGLDQSDLKIAIKQFEDFIIDYPESEVIPDVQKYLKEAKTRLAHKDYNSGVTYVRIGTYKAAEIYFQRVVDNYTNTEYGPLATYGLAEVEFKLKKFDEAKSKFQDFTIVYPEHELIPKAQEYIEKSALKSGIKAFEANEFT
ncbi:MAG: outer membrane protein assembly factor BamD, partial [Calditrichaeota bacterium]